MRFDMLKTLFAQTRHERQPAPALFFLTHIHLSIMAVAVARGLRPITKRAVKAASKNAALLQGARTLVTKAATPSVAQAALAKAPVAQAGAGEHLNLHLV